MRLVFGTKGVKRSSLTGPRRSSRIIKILESFSEPAERASTGRLARLAEYGQKPKRKGDQVIPTHPQSDRAEQLVGRLQASGHRLTPQRLALVDLLSSDTSHPSAEQVFNRLKAQYPTISLATVYNTLEMLVSMGEALPLDLNDGCTRYDVVRPAAHPHVICRRCGVVVDLDLDGLDAMLNQARSAVQFEDLQARVHFEGICSDCARETPEPEEGSGA